MTHLQHIASNPPGGTEHALKLLRATPVALAILAGLPGLAMAQTAGLPNAGLPNAGSLLQQVQPAVTPTAPAASTGLTIVRPAGDTLPPSAPFEVTALHIRGNTLIATEALDALLAEGIGQRLTLAQLGTLVARITAAYQQRGYPLARAFIPAQAIEQGVVQVQVVEARYGAVRIDNRSAVDVSLLSATLAPLQAGQAIEQSELDRALLLLSDVPGVLPMATFRPGAAVGSSDLEVAVEPGAAVFGQATLDSDGSRSTGRTRLGGSVSALNLLGRGDVLGASALSSGNGVNHARVAYDALLNGQGTRLGVSASTLRYELGGSAAALQAHGTAQVQGASLRQPLLRQGGANLSGLLQWDRTVLRDHVDASAIATDRTLHSATASLQGDRRDELLGGGVTLFALGWTAGQVRFDNSTAQLSDAATAQSQGRFTKWTLNLARQQRLGIGQTLLLSFNGQWADKNLDSSQKLSTGGSVGVRGYDTGVAPGDQGRVLSAEYRHELGTNPAGSWQALAFFDTARITLNRQLFTGVQAGTNAMTLSGAGLGLGWTGPDRWSARLSVAAPVFGMPAQLGASHAARVWAEASRAF